MRASAGLRVAWPRASNERYWGLNPSRMIWWPPAWTALSARCPLPGLYGPGLARSAHGARTGVIVIGIPRFVDAHGAIALEPGGTGGGRYIGMAAVG